MQRYQQPDGDELRWRVATLLFEVRIRRERLASAIDRLRESVAQRSSGQGVGTSPVRLAAVRRAIRSDVSIGFDRPNVRPPRFKEERYWVVSNKGRTAEARARVLPRIGLELRILVDSTLVWSNVYRDVAAFKLMIHQSERCREMFEAKGWTRIDTSV